MTCSILSAIMASTKVMNWARKPGCRIAAKDRLLAGGAPAAIDLVSLIKNRHYAARCRSRIRHRDAGIGSSRFVSRTLPFTRPPCRWPIRGRAPQLKCRASIELRGAAAADLSLAAGKQLSDKNKKMAPVKGPFLHYIGFFFIIIFMW